MASPQTENGFVRVANELWDALIKYRIPGEQEQCLKVIIRQTYGYNKKRCEISLKVFENSTGINKPNISRALRGLKEKNVISIIKKDNRSDSTYGINKNYDSWKSLSKKITPKSLSKKIITVIKKDNAPIKDKLKDIAPKVKTKEKLQFENKVKIPSYFHLTEEMKQYAAEKGITFDLEYFTENMINACKAKGYKYKDWHAAWQVWIRRDWAKQKPVETSTYNITPKESDFD